MRVEGLVDERPERRDHRGAEERRVEVEDDGGEARRREAEAPRSRAGWPHSTPKPTGTTLAGVWRIIMRDEPERPRRGRARAETAIIAGSVFTPKLDREERVARGLAGDLLGDHGRRRDHGRTRAGGETAACKASMPGRAATTVPCAAEGDKNAAVAHPAVARCLEDPVKHARPPARGHGGQPDPDGRRLLLAPVELRDEHPDRCPEQGPGDDVGREVGARSHALDADEPGQEDTRREGEPRARGIRAALEGEVGRRRADGGGDRRVPREERELRVGARDRWTGARRARRRAVLVERRLLRVREGARAAHGDLGQVRDCQGERARLGVQHSVHERGIQPVAIPGKDRVDSREGDGGAQSDVRVEGCVRVRVCVTAVLSNDRRLLVVPAAEGGARRSTE